MMDKYPKRLIEVDLPIKRISAHARREKDMRKGHIPNLLIYPASRPTASCRAVACASLWPDPDDDCCPVRFIDIAKQLMMYWGKKNLNKCSSESYPRFNKIIKKPENLNSPNELRKLLLDFIADFANWDNSIDAEFLAVARTLTVSAHDSLQGMNGFNMPELITTETLNESIKDISRPLLVDSFAGGGAIPIEGLRCGADAFASDLNPIAILLNRVSTIYVPKYGKRLIDEIQRWLQWVRQKAAKDLAPYYPADSDGSIPIAYLWARTIQCEGPGCGANVPLMRSLMLARKEKNKVGLQFVVSKEAGDWAFRIIKRKSGQWVYQDSSEVFDQNPNFEGTIKRGAATCPCCSYTTPRSSVVSQLKDRSGGSDDALMFVVVTKKPGEQGRKFRLADQEDILAARSARNLNSNSNFEVLLSEPTPIGGGKGAGRAFSQQNYGMTRWSDIYNSRQLNALEFYSSSVKDFILTIHDDELSEAVSSCLTLIVCRLADLNAALCVWQLNTPNTSHVFGRWALQITWDYGEINPLAQAGGSPESAVRRMVRIISYLSLGIEREGEVLLSSAYSHPYPDDCAELFFTDPPYYDAIPYSDLMDFFYVWMRRTLCNSLAQLVTGNLCPKEDECIVDEIKGKDRDYYEHGMLRAMIEGKRVLSPGGVGVIVFAHKSTSGWEAQLESLVKARWRITASWPIDTEMGSRLRAKNSAALASSVHLVCRPCEDKDGLIIEKVGDWRDVLSELPGRISAWLPRLASEGVVGADAIFACLGPALEIFSRYSSVEKASGEVVPLREYLEHVWAEVARQALNMIFEDADASGFEEDARLTAMWLWTLRTDANGNGTEDEKAISLPGYTLEYDAARKIAQGLGCHLEHLTYLVEVKGSKAMLLSAESRARYLFGKQEVGMTARPGKKKESAVQLDLFSLTGSSDEEEAGVRQADLERPPAGKTVLDQLHQAMLLFTAGRGAALKRFLVDDGIGSNPQFWTLAQALSALYPPHTNEKRWVDGVLARKKGLGF